MSLLSRIRWTKILTDVLATVCLAYGLGVSWWQAVLVMLALNWIVHSQVKS